MMINNRMNITELMAFDQTILPLSMIQNTIIHHCSEHLKGSTCIQLNGLVITTFTIESDRHVGRRSDYKHSLSCCYCTFRTPLSLFREEHANFSSSPVYFVLVQNTDAHTHTVYEIQSNPSAYISSGNTIDRWKKKIAPKVCVCVFEPVPTLCAVCVWGCV